VYALYTVNSTRHGAQPSRLDKNFGGVLIIFNRIFGVFAAPPEREPLRYGLTEPLGLQNPLYVVFPEWVRMAADLGRARSLRDVWRTLFGAPCERETTVHKEKEKGHEIHPDRAGARASRY